MPTGVTDRRLFPDAFARELMSRAGRPYRPCNGDEGEAFDSLWCNHCTKDAKYRAADDPISENVQGCIIIAKTMSFQVNDKNYPREWQYGSDGQPRCTAFEEVKP